MPPRARSNRVEKLAYQRMLALGVPFNVFGLLALPDELILLIVSFFPTCRIPEETRKIPENGFAPRHKTLLVLTMTCRALRRVCLPLLWQRIEARLGMRSVIDIIPKHGGRQRSLYDKSLSRETLRQLETVTVREPKYAVYVNIINLDLGIQSIDTLLQELLNSMELFPRLHTVRLRTSTVYLIGKDLKRAQAVVSSWRPKEPLLSIKRWFSNRLLSQVMAFCPNLHTAGGLFFGPLELGQLERIFPSPMIALERLENVFTPFSATLPAGIAQKCPNLRHIGIKTVRNRRSSKLGYAPFGQTLSIFRNLDSVEFQISSRSWPTDDSWRDKLASGPIKVLKQIQEQDGRVKRLALRESLSDGLEIRRLDDFVLPLHGKPTSWTKGQVEVQP